MKNSLNTTIIDGRILDTDNRFFDYCLTNHIKNPFRESQDRFSKRVERKRAEMGHDYWTVDPEEEAWLAEWAKRRDEYLRLSYTFRLWDFHFWMDWPQFEQHLRWSKEFTDINIYMPCDCADRQCNTTCAYFGAKCPREEEELKNPLNFEGRWEFQDEDESWYY